MNVSQSWFPLLLRYYYLNIVTRIEFDQTVHNVMFHYYVAGIKFFCSYLMYAHVQFQCYNRRSIETKIIIYDVCEEFLTETHSVFGECFPWLYKRQFIFLSYFELFRYLLCEFHSNVQRERDKEKNNANCFCFSSAQQQFMIVTVLITISLLHDFNYNMNSKQKQRTVNNFFTCFYIIFFSFFFEYLCTYMHMVNIIIKLHDEQCFPITYF